MNLNSRIFPPAAPFFAELDRLLGQALRDVPSLTNDTHVYENADTRFLVVELPGFRKEEIRIQVDGPILSLEAKPTDESRPFLTSVERRWKLNNDTDVARIEARFEHGLLTLSLPKRQEENTSREIPLL